MVSLWTVSMAAECMQCVPSEAVSIFLLIFWMSVFYTHQSQTQRSAVCTFSEQTVFSCLTAAHSLTEVLTPPQDETFGISTLLRSRPGSTLFKSLFCLICCPGHLPSLARIVEAFPHLSSFSGWIALSQGQLLSQTYFIGPI